ncbi:hypothetical protein QBC32DRAFT_143528 [Pseudoneurospora amorphoporcata]|uniref:Uncharacterized protein n=1 Tax=Pseudoneurospora amorphoporcata TaxID=241081 RepID=A0AAN6NYQ2_9PEZI|nr:hypothetical protein QBC32DRAFT_143528 [Pseudoneurospora amorphoporcata]
MIYQFFCAFFQLTMMLQMANPTGARDRGANKNIDSALLNPSVNPNPPNLPTFVQDTSEPSASAPNTQVPYTVVVVAAHALLAPRTSKERLISS